MLVYVGIKCGQNLTPMLTIPVRVLWQGKEAFPFSTISMSPKVPNAFILVFYIIGKWNHGAIFISSSTYR